MPWPSGGPELDADELWLRYRQGALYAYVAPLITAGMGGMQDESIALEGVRRGVTADGVAQFDEVWPLSRTEIAETGTVVERSGVNVALRMRPADPESCQWRASHSVRYARGDWDCRIECRVELAASAEAFELRETVVARRGERRVFEREHRATIPRDLM